VIAAVSRKRQNEAKRHVSGHRAKQASRIVYKVRGCRKRIVWAMERGMAVNRDEICFMRRAHRSSGRIDVD